MKFKGLKANEDGLDEVYAAYQELRRILELAIQRPPGARGPDYILEIPEMYHSVIEETLDCLEYWLVEESRKRGGLE